MPYKREFPEQLAEYVTLAREAVRQKKHHDHRRSLFVNFLRLAYDVDPTEVEIEHKVKVAHVRGYIDALFKQLIIEFKVDLERERPAALLELKKYFAAQKNPREYIAIVTDGLRFELYLCEQGDINLFSSFRLDDSDPLTAYRSLDAVLFSSQKVTPGSADITARFGPSSAVFNQSRLLLQELYETVRTNSTVAVKFDEWNSLLARVYGEELGDESLFLRHTYLTMFSRLLVTNALFPEVRKTRTVFRGLLTGKFFGKNNLTNLAEPDFFSWALGTDVETDFIGFLSSIDKYLTPFALDNINEDILKEIYQELVDPSARHSLGEYYTPDWIADLALSIVKYKRGKILDPACGSGTFLLAVVRYFRSKGLKGTVLVRNVLDSVLGLDVHPLAVMMSKANILLSLAKEIKTYRKEIYLPVYMADTLLVSEDPKAKSVVVNVSEDERFDIPIETTLRSVNVDELIDYMASVCTKAARSERFQQGAWKALEKRYLHDFSDNERFFWKNNFRLFTKLIRQGRNSIWAFILKNAYRPAYIRENKVDFVVGNPPWLSYRYVKDKGYKTLVKELTFRYKLLDRGEVKLFTQMDTSTLFFAYSEAQFLGEKGRIAFVLPKTVILPAKQHRNFQERGLSQIHDFSGVSPLFNVRSVLAVRGAGKHRTQEVPAIEYVGRLPLKNMTWPSARRYLQRRKTTIDFKFMDSAQSYYYPRFLQGATIVPRCFWFIQDDKHAAVHSVAPRVETADEAFAEAKDRWRLRLQGQVEKPFIFETVLAKGLLPFCVFRTEKLFLPLRLMKDSVALADAAVLLEHGFDQAATWMQEAEELWEARRQSKDRTLVQWLNYNQKLTKQNPSAKCVVLYNTSGTHIAAAVYAPQQQRSAMRPRGFLAESVTYYLYPRTIREGFYVAAVLNSGLVNRAIKAWQPQGLFGERHIHRRPFEVCAIPRFHHNDPIHRELADIGKKSQAKVAKLAPQLAGTIGRMRSEVRRVLKPELDRIDKLVGQLLTDAGQDVTLINSASKRIKNGDLFK
ncbi:MAG: N-6 DNA methylase [candidate division Zixibacteria bacterium]|nr:N-6 DNA methylase [candidate division Zixibacteria bacterium]